MPATRGAWGGVFLVGLALLAALGSGSASACDLIEEPPEPGLFILHTLEGDAFLYGVVDERSLGATCELSNPFAYAEPFFVWAEPDQATSTLHIADTQDASHDQETVEGRISNGVSVFDASIVYLVREDSAWTPYTLDLEAGTTAPVGIDPGNYLVDGALIVDRSPRSDTVSVYDVRNASWLLEDAPLEDLGIPEGAHVATVSDPWVAFTEDGEDFWMWAPGLDAARATAQPLHGSPLGAWLLDGEHTYMLDGGQLVRTHLFTGDQQRLGWHPQTLFSVEDETVVHGAYSAAWAGFEERDWPKRVLPADAVHGQGPNETITPWPGFLLIATAALTAAHVRTRRKA